MLDSCDTRAVTLKLLCWPSQLLQGGKAGQNLGICRRQLNFRLHYGVMLFQCMAFGVPVPCWAPNERDEVKQSSAFFPK